MEKRLVLFIVISVLILVGSSYLLPPKRTVQVKQETAVSTSVEPQVDKNLSVSVPIGRPVDKPAPEEKNITVDTPLYHAVLTNKGGTIEEWNLKEYTESDRKTGVKLLKEEITLLPLSLELKENRDYFLKGIYQVEGDNINLSIGKTEGTIIFYLKVFSVSGESLPIIF